MQRFGKSFLYRNNISLLQKVFFYLLGHDFIGAEIRLSHFKKIIKRIPFFKTVLDAGCGTGDFSFYVAEHHPKSTFFAYDITSKTLKKNRELKKKLSCPNITFSYNDLRTLHEKNKYDFIFSIGTLIYFTQQDTKKILVNLTRALKPGGYLYLDLPQENFLEVNWIPITSYPTYYQALKNENSGDLYTFEEMQKLLCDLGYDILFVNKSFSYAGKLAWELDNLLKEKQLTKIRFFLLPPLKLMARLDSLIKNKKGCCFVILARKHGKATC